MQGLSDSTYKDLVEDYQSTQESTMWHARYLIGNSLNEHTGQDKLLSSFVDQESPQDTNDIGVLGLNVIDEMAIEPLLKTHQNQVSINLYLMSKPGLSVPVCLSTYGVKHIIFKIPACLICVDDDKQYIYIPSRIPKRIIDDMKYRGIACSMYGKDLKLPYVSIEIPQNLLTKVQEIYRQSNPKPVTINHEPMCTDGFPSYLPTTITMSIELCHLKEKRSRRHGQDMIIQKKPREISIVVLDVEAT